MASTRQRGRCQCCGRNKALTRGGVLVAHYLKGERCFGSGAVPYENGDDAIIRAIEYHEGRDDALTAQWKASIEKDTEARLGLSFWRSLSFTAGEILRLRRRLKKQRRLFGVASFPPTPKR